MKLLSVEKSYSEPCNEFLFISFFVKSLDILSKKIGVYLQSLLYQHKDSYFHWYHANLDGILFFI